MSAPASAALTVPAVATRGSSVLRELAFQEIRRYATHPLFLLGLVLVTAATATGPDEYTSSLGHDIVPSTGFGVLGLLVMGSLVRSSDKAAASAGVVAASERTRTLALASAVVVPLAASLLWFTWAVWAYTSHPPTPNGLPFGGVGASWSYSVLFAVGVLASVGGPLLGLLVGRFLNFRGAAPMAAAVLVLFTIVMQGLIEPLRYIRVFAPWTRFGGPYGAEGDNDRQVIFTGSPQWYVAYLVALCVLGVILALLHDREAPRRRMLLGFAIVGVVALVLGTLAMTQGVQELMVNPLPSGSA